MLFIQCKISLNCWRNHLLGINLTEKIWLQYVLQKRAFKFVAIDVLMDITVPNYKCEQKSTSLKHRLMR